MPPLKPILLACATVLALALLPAQALAVSRATADCNAHNKLTRHYSVAELRTALNTMPADVKEYTSCYQIIQDQLFRQLGKKVPSSSSGSSNGSSSSFISTPLLIVIIVVILLGGVLALLAARRGGGAGGGNTPPPAGS